MSRLASLFRRLAAAVAILTALLPSVSAARDLGTPTGPVILTVTGQDGTTWTFDREMIAQLGWTTITSVTSFTDGPQEFSGIPLSALIDATGTGGTVVEATALNDYRVELPFAHAAEHGVFLALDHNGEPMRVRDRGPIWIVYPQETLQPAQDRFDTFMVWQLRDLVFR
ncbi:MAG: molybdopterin-dependent oxidoreductase [Rhodobacteraceae bacterium]|nr:molybdopterin-dependent oxidoreductase [Paracoccaceae bacterium]